jgi:hypothetical protein
MIWNNNSNKLMNIHSIQPVSNYFSLSSILILFFNKELFFYIIISWTMALTDVRSLDGSEEMALYPTAREPLECKMRIRYSRGKNIERTSGDWIEFEGSRTIKLWFDFFPGAGVPLPFKCLFAKWLPCCSP